MDLVALAQQLNALTPAQRAEALNQLPGGYDVGLGRVLKHVAADRVVATVEVGPQHTQPYGLVHGGVYATLGEGVCSVGAAMAWFSQGKRVVGVENTTRFLRATRPGTTLTADARPLPDDVGPRRGVWEASITDGDGQQVAISRVTVAILDADREVAGETLTVPDPSGGD